MPVKNNYPIGSIEYIAATVTANVPLDAQTVELSVDSGVTWLAAEWTGDVDTTRACRTTDPVAFPTRTYHRCMVRLTDTPEVPVMVAGVVTAG